MLSGNVTLSRRHVSPFSFHVSISCVSTPGRAKRNGVFLYVHIAYPAKYPSCSLSHVVSKACPLKDPRGLSLSPTTPPSSDSMAIRSGLNRLDSSSLMNG